MADDQPVHIEGYALTHGDYDRPEWVEHIERSALEAAVAQRPTVPLRLGFDGPVIGEARLNVDDTGLLVTADIEPQGFAYRGVDEGVPYGDQVHDTAVPNIVRAGGASLNAAYRVNSDGQQWSDEYRLRRIHELSIENISIAPSAAESRAL